MKKLSLGLALLGLSTSLAHAGGVDYEESGIFTVGAAFLYAEPANGDFLYANTFDSGNVNFQGHKARSNDPSFDWGYRININYAMAGDSPDFSLSWTNLDTSDTDSTSFVGYTFGNNGAPSANVLNFIDTFVPFTGAGPASVSFFAGVDSVSARTEYDYTNVDLVMGKEFVLQNRYHFHPFAGIHYAEIEAKDRVNYINSTPASGSLPLHSQVVVKNEFNGIGPRAGLDGAMEISNGFSFVASAAGSLVIGDFDWKAMASSFTYTNDAVSSVDHGESKNHNENIIVPQVDYRVAVNYAHEFSPETMLNAELGWNGMHYFDVMDKSLARAHFGTVGNMSDWAFQGPYLKLAVSVA